MNRHGLLIVVSILLATTSCKTQEQIQREQIVDNLSSQMVESQKQRTEYHERIEQLENKIASMTGDYQVLEHNIKNNQDEEKQLLNQRIKTLEEQVKSLTDENKKQFSLIAAKQSEQEGLIKQMLRSVDLLANKGSKKSSKKKKKISEYDRAMLNYNKAYYKTAKPILDDLLSKKKVKGLKRAQVLHHLGFIAYKQKKDQDALVYFSKLFTEHQKSGWNGHGLWTMHLALKRMKKNEEATSALESLAELLPKHKYGKKAKAELAKKGKK